MTAELRIGAHYRAAGIDGFTNNGRHVVNAKFNSSVIHTHSVSFRTRNSVVCGTGPVVVVSNVVVVVVVSYMLMFLLVL